LDESATRDDGFQFEHEREKTGCFCFIACDMSIVSVRAHVNVGEYFHIYIHLYIFTKRPSCRVFFSHASICPLEANLQYPNETQAGISATHSGLWWPPAPSPRPPPLLKLEMTGTL
jgi:hypothetical protein